MMEIDSELPFSAEEGDVAAVDDNDVISGVVQGMVDGFVLPL